MIEPGTPWRRNLVKDHLAMLHTKFQASKPSGSEEEDFLIFFYAFLWFEPMTPDQRPSWTQGPSFEQNW